MKNIALLVLSVFVLIFLPSCEVIHEGQGGGYSQMPPRQHFAGQQQSDGEQIGEKCYIKIGAQAPQPVVQAVENRAADVIQGKFSDSCFAADGCRGTWCTPEEVDVIVGDLFKAKGYNLQPGRDQEPDCFKVMEYRPGIVVGGQEHPQLNPDP